MVAGACRPAAPIAYWPEDTGGMLTGNKDGVTPLSTGASGHGGEKSG
ncbi:hypothetical protein Dret_0707 [Desulfohalobium retbaense DSM 5692]|uniref:Uncharacterized protein n=1 Tax=Desulfohalobium retbaense (strain ATCC 49708 / DSM 5692 / JCM 16813 / HR100) TaxID=485915 RepID=C8X0Q2_DESRD|nr:hypothetical protein Dret_0707 [Desulfohalobium retbaense DSM 5692]